MHCKNFNQLLNIEMLIFKEIDKPALWGTNKGRNGKRKASEGVCPMRGWLSSGQCDSLVSSKLVSVTAWLSRESSYCSPSPV